MLNVEGSLLEFLSVDKGNSNIVGPRATPKEQIIKWINSEIDVQRYDTKLITKKSKYKFNS